MPPRVVSLYIRSKYGGIYPLLGINQLRDLISELLTEIAQLTRREPKLYTIVDPCAELYPMA
jgi:hypothetical protein